MTDTPETDAQLTSFTSISKLKKPFVNRTGTVSAEFARKLERERSSLQDQRDFCMGEIERLRKEAAQKDKLLAEMRAAIRWAASNDLTQCRQ